jgi:hypothetical protein
MVHLSLLGCRHPEPPAEGQVRTFKIVKLIAESKRIEVEMA